MSVSSKPLNRYSNTMIIAHWALAIIIAVHLVNAFTLHLLQDFQTALIFRELHRSFGLLILVAMVARLVLRLRSDVPPIRENIPNWQRSIAKLNHFAMYFLLMFLPFLGWAYSNSIGAPVSFFWVIPLPDIVPYDVDTGFMVLEAHKYLSMLLIGFVALHIAASFYNKYVLKNKVFEKILMLKDSHLFSSYLPIWVRMSITSCVALGGCAIIGFSGIASSGKIGEAYDQIFQSVVNIRAAQVNWERLSAKLSGSQQNDVKAVEKSLKKIKKHLKKAAPNLSKQMTRLRVDKLVTRLEIYTQNITSDAVNDETFDIADENKKIGKQFNRIIQETAAIVYETRQHFETLAAQQNDRVVFILVGVFCLSAIIIAIMTASTSVQISKAAGFAKYISEGNLFDPMHVEGNSETAGLMRSLDHMRKSLKNQFEWIKDQSQDNDEDGNDRMKRQTVRKKISIFIANVLHDTFTIDISENGMCIQAIDGLVEGQEIQVVNQFGAKQPAYVIWIYNDMAGIQFIESMRETA